MKKKICPYCDQVMSEGMYCRGCRRIVLKPVIWDVDYYLNERHPASETQCQYHGDLYTGEIKGRKSVPGKQTASGGQPEAVSRLQTKYRNQTIAGNRKAGRNQTAARNQAASRGKTTSFRKVGVVFIIYVIIMIASAGVKAYESFREASSDIVKMFTPGPEPETAVAWEAEAPAVDLSGQEETFGSGALTEEEVREAGIPCNGYGHFDVGEEAAELFESLLDASSFQWSVSTYNYNWSGNGHTWFDNMYDYELTHGEDYCGYVLLKFDTADGRMHGLELVFENEEDMYEAADMSLVLFHEIGILEEYQDGQSLFEEAASGGHDGMSGILLQDGVEISCDVLEDGCHLMYIYAETE